MNRRIHDSFPFVELIDAMTELLKQNRSACMNAAKNIIRLYFFTFFLVKATILKSFWKVLELFSTGVQVHWHDDKIIATRICLALGSHFSIVINF